MPKIAQGETVLVSPCTLIQLGSRPPLAGCAPGVSRSTRHNLFPAFKSTALGKHLEASDESRAGVEPALLEPSASWLS